MWLKPKTKPSIPLVKVGWGILKKNVVFRVLKSEKDVGI